MANIEYQNIELSTMWNGSEETNDESRLPPYSPPAYPLLEQRNTLPSNAYPYVDVFNASSQSQQNNHSSPIIIIQQPNLKQKFFYRRIIFTIILVAILTIVLRSLFLAIHCDQFHPINMLRVIENRRYAIEDMQRQTKIGEWFWCSNRRSNDDLLAQPLKIIEESISVKVLTEQRITELMARVNENSTFQCENKTESRIEQLQNTCKLYQFQKRILSPWHLSTPAKCDNIRHCPLLVDDQARIISCLVPKVFEQSTFKRIFSRQEIDDNRLISPIEDSQNLVNYTRIMFTRHPFVRLVEAFKKRFELPKYTAEGKPMVIDQEIVHIWNFEEWCEEFLLLTDPYQYDFSWAPIWIQCEPCFVKYDLIGKYESMSYDLDQIQDRIGNQNRTIFNYKTNDCDPKSYAETRNYLMKLTPKTILRLYKKYYLDFELFGYTIEEIFQ